MCKMNSYIEKYKGIHNWYNFAEGIKKESSFAASICPFNRFTPQTLNAITTGKRNLNTFIVLKIQSKLGLKEVTLALLQTFYDVLQEKKKLEQNTPDLSILLKSLFWDTEIYQIDWNKQYKAIIQ